MPQLKPRYKTVDLNLYVPRFIEVPIPAEFMDEVTIAEAEQYMHQVAIIASQTAPSLCDVENLAGTIKTSGIASILRDGDYQTSLKKAWKNGKIRVSQADAVGRGANSPVPKVMHNNNTSEVSQKPKRRKRLDKSEEHHHTRHHHHRHFHKNHHK